MNVLTSFMILYVTGLKSILFLSNNSFLDLWNPTQIEDIYSLNSFILGNAWWESVFVPAQSIVIQAMVDIFDTNQIISILKINQIMPVLCHEVYFVE